LAARDLQAGFAPVAACLANVAAKQRARAGACPRGGLWPDPRARTGVQNNSLEHRA